MFVQATARLTSIELMERHGAAGPLLQVQVDFECCLLPGKTLCASCNSPLPRETPPTLGHLAAVPPLLELLLLLLLHLALHWAKPR